MPTFILEFYTQQQMEENEINPRDLYVIRAKVEAFDRAYSHTDCEHGAEVYDDARLRSFFNAYPTATFDPLVWYTEELTAIGFRMNINLSGEPVFFVHRRGAAVAYPNLAMLLGAPEEGQEEEREAERRGE